jgi:carbamoyltransferase
MKILGINALGHDASVSVILNNDIVFAAHSERYSRKKNDEYLNDDLLNDALNFEKPDIICWYERPWIKKARQIMSGQWNEVVSITPSSYLAKFGLSGIPIKYYSHHYSHASAGYFTSPFENACVVIVDAIGEFTTISIWKGNGSKLAKVWSQNYPHSLGLLYTAMTQRCGFKPNEEEYITMGMAAFGKPVYVEDIKNDFISNMNAPYFRLKHNVHRGILWWKPEIKNVQDIAASIQKITNDYLIDLMIFAKKITNSNNLVFGGGVALNCVSNTQIASQCKYDDIWIMPNPGDSGSSLGAALAYHSKHIEWKTPYLGYNIDRIFLDMNGILNSLEMGEIIGIANGKAEFGPRALGNRSLLADPRGKNIKDRMNQIKKRELFRPFAPMILEHMAHQYFDMPVKESPYMQYAVTCKYPDQFPAICHIDNSSRIQTVTNENNPILFELLSKWHKRTGCGMLLNTSLNIKGEPLVNSWEDANKFSFRHNIKIF